jgi:hypothetical protein
MRWIPSRHNFFLHVDVLSEVFRGKFDDGLKAVFRHNQLKFHGDLAPLADPRAFARWRRTLFRHDWVVYAKPPFGGPEHALRYLSGYGVARMLVAQPHPDPMSRVPLLARRFYVRSQHLLDVFLQRAQSRRFSDHRFSFGRNRAGKRLPHHPPVHTVLRR